MDFTPLETNPAVPDVGEVADLDSADARWENGRVPDTLTR